MEYVMKKRPYICTAKLRNIQMFVEYWILYLLRMQCYPLFIRIETELWDCTASMRSWFLRRTTDGKGW